MGGSSIVSDYRGLDVDDEEDSKFSLSTEEGGKYGFTVRWD